MHDRAAILHHLMEAQGGLLDRLHVRGVNDLDIILDCREFKDPNLDKSILSHTGYHCHVAEHTVKQNRFEHAITEVVKEAKLHCKKSNDTFPILCLHKRCAQISVFRDCIALRPEEDLVGDHDPAYERGLMEAT